MSMSFRLSDAFIEPYKTRRPEWGYTDAAGNSVGELVFLRTYSRVKPCEAHGNVGDECDCPKAKEEWWEVCRRVIEGMFSIQKDYCRANRLPWNDAKAHATAKDAYERLFTFRWTPPGRGLWMMGTPLVMEHRNSAALQNCAFVSTADMTKDDPAGPFAFLMEASMLGIGVGFDTKGAEKGFEVYAPDYDGIDDTVTYWPVPDTREGWVESVRLLIESYLKPGRQRVEFYYGHIRKAGEPIRTFGGTAAGPEPLMRLHESLRALLDGYVGRTLDTRAIADIGNLIGVCVVSGNVRRSAELCIGSVDDDVFLNLKNYDRYPERAEFGWMSNNSVAVEVGDDLSGLAEHIARNGEPGVIWLDVSRQYGRLKDAPDGRDWRVAGFNPCAEQSLESYECCTLVETYLNRHDDLDDYLKTLKVAYLYAKTVTLLPTHWERTNAIMQRNRRIGTSMSGVANFVDRNGLPMLRRWANEGYDEVKRLDRIYSEWLCVRESIKTTTVKPSGTVSILAGESPGAHWAPGGQYIIRRVTFGKDDPIVAALRLAGYRVEPSAQSPDTSVVVEFPVETRARRSERDVSIFEKAHLAATLQREWSDNSVSVTLSYDPETEAQHIGTILAMYEGALKTVSFLPMGGAYPQMPFEDISEEAYLEYGDSLFPVDFGILYGGDVEDAEGEVFCTTDVCLMPTERNDDE